MARPRFPTSSLCALLACVTATCADNVIAPDETEQLVPPGISAPIVFASARDSSVIASGASDVYRLDVDGGLSNLTNTPAAHEEDPVASPDGRLIAFTLREGCCTSRGVWVMNAEGGERRYVTDGTDPAWSPGGTGLLTVIDGAIWLSPLDGGERTAVAGEGTGTPSEPACSPDGARIAHMRGQVDPGHDNPAANIWLMGADGSGSVQLTDSPHFDASPTWSPDGTRIAYSQWTTGPPLGTSDMYVRVVNVDGSNDVLLRTVEEPCCWSHPAWSPDGSQLVFVAKNESGRDLYLMDLDEGRLTRLTHHPASDRHPSFLGN